MSNNSSFRSPLEALRRVFPLPENSFTQLASCFRQQRYRKGYQPIKKGYTSHKLYLIYQGIARAFTYKGEKEVTLCFNQENELIFSYRSYIMDEAGYETIELLEDSVLYAANLSDVKNLYKRDLALANWGRKLAENALINTETQLMAMQFHSAYERYDRLITNSPDLIRRVPLRYIASFLGISQVTLSRIRGSIK